jgi:hypothetical protein
MNCDYKDDCCQYKCYECIRNNDATEQAYDMYTSKHRTTANVRFRWLKAIFTKITKVTSYIHKRCVKGVINGK